MQVGDLVTLRKTPTTRMMRPSHYFGKMGIIVEWTTESAVSSGWVKWSFNPDLDIEYEEDLELISANR